MGLSEKPWFRRLLVTMGGSKHVARFDRISRALRATQDEVLQRLVAESANTVFGREHRFSSIRTFSDYRSAVPIGDFETHRPYVDRMQKGEANVLFPGKPIIYNTTSGTTNKPKMIPISAPYFQRSIADLNRLWLYACLRDNPHLYDGKSLSAVSPAQDGVVADGTPYGSVSGLSYKNIPAILKSTHSCPYAALCIRDYQLKYYAMVRYALECNITYIVSPSPSNILRLHQTVMEQTEALLKDIRDGTLKADVAAGLPAEQRAAALAWLKPNRARAQELESLMRAHGGNFRPKHYWPNVACINVWKQGNFALMIPKLDGYFPESTVYREFGYQASEVRAGLVLGNEWTYSALAAHVSHFEFMPESERESHAPRTLLAHEVEKGARYYLLFSNGSGLYRYDINDLVEVCGFYNQVPLFRFIQKGEGVTSLTGEKLSELQVIQAMSEVTAGSGIAVENYLLFCDEKEQEYKLFVEYGASAVEAGKKHLVKALDERLRAFNPEYASKRESRRLPAPRAIELGPGSHERIKAGLIARGHANAGQYKDLYLTKRPVVLEILRTIEKG